VILRSLHNLAARRETIAVLSDGVALAQLATSEQEPARARARPSRT